MRLRTDSYIVTGSIGVSDTFFFPIVRPLVEEEFTDGGALPVPFVALAGFEAAELMPPGFVLVYLDFLFTTVLS